ncbi:MAG: Uncharacterised protein [Candidatus Nitrosopelagicus brevis]|nr:MAG: Uncharacterised protein [Candidatus Nitrosopelagicus brevis]
MELFLEGILNLIGFVVGLIIGTFSYIGYKNTGSPVLFRLTIAFFAIGLGFGIIWSAYIINELVFDTEKINRGIQALGLGIQTIGYFFIAFSHTIKSFFPKSRYFRSVGILPLFALSAMNIEHIIRSFSFILLVYGAIETFVSFLEGKQKGALAVGTGLALLAFGEFIAWYSLVFPESILYSVSILLKISGLISLFLPISRLPLRKIKFDDLDDDEDDMKFDDLDDEKFGR